jgi:hypothetical protein
MTGGHRHDPSDVGLGREDIRALLDDLSAELAAREARAELFDLNDCLR